MSYSQFIFKLTAKLTKGRRVSRHTRSQLTGFEQLERRTVLAGNVLAVVSGGNLVLTGDDDSNSVVVDQTGLAADQFRISSGSNPTLINGGAGPVILGGITKGLDAELEDGDDNLQLNNGELPDNVKIDGDDGNNSIGINSFNIGGDFEFRGEEGFDFVLITDSNFDGNAKFEYEDGGDDGLGSFRSSLITIANSFFAGNLTIKGEDGIDSAFFNATTVEGNVKIETKDGGGLFFGPFAGGGAFFQNSVIGGNLEFKNEVGIDQFDLISTTVGGDAKIETGDGADDGTGALVGTIPSSIINSVIGGNLEIKGGSGMDIALTITGSTLQGNAKIDYGNGGSSTFIGASTVADNLEVKSKAGTDTVLIAASTVWGDTKIRTGDDDDFVSTVDSFFAAFEADGGDGFDVFEDLGGNTFVKALKLEHFELILS